MTTIETILHRASTGKKALMMEREFARTLLEPVREFAFDVAKPVVDRKPFIEVYKAFERMANDIAIRKAANVSLSMRRHIQRLQEAHLTNKRNVLHTIPVVSTPVAASYLGVPPDALLTSENHCKAVLSLRYIGMTSYSMSDLQLIAENPHWMLPHVPKAQAGLQKGLRPVPAYQVFVDWEVATAYTDMTLDELNKCVKKSTHPARPYRLSDLEMIRVTKLNGQQH